MQKGNSIMPVHVDEMVSEVSAETGSPAPASNQQMVPWQELERLREAQAELAYERRRTEANGYDD
jgi:hypothetical protein